MKQVTINLYSFNELSEQAKQKAINEHMDFLLNEGEMQENEAGVLETVYYDEIPENEVIESIEANDYVFFQDGSLAHCTTYTGKHEKAGITEFNFKGAVYRL